MRPRPHQRRPPPGRRPRAPLGLMIAFLFCGAQAWAGTLTRADVVRLALLEHPAATASAAQAAAARTAAAGEGAAAPLWVEAGLAPGMTQMGRPGVEVAAGWALPLWGMGELARSAAAARADMAAAADRMTRAELAAWASIAVDDWRLAQERLRVLGHHATTMEAARDAVARRVAAGLAPPGAEAMARMAVLDVEERRIVAERARAEAEAALRAIAGISASQLAAEIPPLRAAPTATRIDPAGLSPSVQMARAELAMRGDMAEMARRNGRPMVAPMASINTMWPDPMDWAMVGVMVEIPIDAGALRAQRQAAQQEQQAAVAALAAAERSRLRALTEAVAMADMAAAMEALMVDKGEPLAVEQARLARTAWEAGQSPVGEWLDAEAAVLEARLRVAEAQAERSRAIAMIAMITGQPLDPTPEGP